METLKTHARVAEWCKWTDQSLPLRRYIGAILHAFELDTGNYFISPNARVWERGCARRHSQHATARGQQTALIISHGTCVKDNDTFEGFRLFKFGDRFAVLKLAG